MKNVIFKLIVPLLGIVAMLAFVTFFNPVKQQDAAWLEGTQHYACGEITVYIAPHSENQACSTGTAKISNYQTSMDIWATGSNASRYTAHWNWASYWCANDTSAPCLDNGTQTGEHTVNLASSHTVYSNTSSPRGQFAGLACGHYQNDFGFYVTNSSGATVCGISLSNLGNRNNNASWCHAGTCQVPTNTPVPSATNTPTPSATGTPVPTNTIVPPTATATPANTNNCGDNNQSGNNDNNNCNNNNNQNNNNNNQSQSQTQNNNQTVNISLGGGQQQQQQQVLGMTTLPKTGGEGQVLLGLLALIPVGWKLRKLV